MTIIKCKMCGGDVALSPDKSMGICEYCGCSMTVPKADSEQRVSAFNRGNHFRRIGEFDKALTIYERIVREDDSDAEAHWCCALCRFGIEYVEDPNTYEWFPTCHRVSFDSFLEDVDYKAAVEHSEGVTKRQYIKEGMKIAEVQKGILLTSQNTKPYDIFLCYKETDENGNRTRDSILAQEIYYRLTEQGRSVFFSRITLEDVPGTAYEPYIFAALNSAKVMIVVGTNADYLNAPWVKNEWSRFLTLMKKDRSKLMIPCYRDMDPYDLPEQLGVLQSFDMGKIGFLQDLTHGISKVLDSKPTQQEKIVIQQTTANATTLMKRVFFFLEDGDWKSADEYCEKVLDIDPENGEAYFGKLMAEYKISREADLVHIADSCLNSGNFQKALRFGNESVQEKLENIRKNVIYQGAKKLAEHSASREQQKGNLREAIRQLQEIQHWRDSNALIADYQAQLQKIREQEDEEQKERQRRKQQKEEKRNTVRQKQESFWSGQKVSFLKKWIVVILCVVILAELLIFGGLIPKLFRKDAATAPENTQPTEKIQSSGTISTEKQPDGAVLSEEELQYQQAEAWEADGQLGRAAIAFGKLEDYSDSWQRSFALWEKIIPRTTLSNSYAIQSDQTVICAKNNSSSAVMSQWQNVVEIAGGFGLLSDGTVVVSGGDNKAGECNVTEWTNVVDIVVNSCGYRIPIGPGGWRGYVQGYTLGLRADGTVLATGDNNWGQCDVSEWTDIIAIGTDKYRASEVPVKYKIAVRTEGSDTAESYDNYYTVGLKVDGTIVTAGKIPKNWDLSGWTDIMKISISGDHLAGLKTDGTVISTCYDQSEVSGWNNITDIDAGPYHLIGLRSDGTVEAVGNNYAYKHLEVEDWTDIAAISVSNRHTVGLKSDGTVVAVGSNRLDANSYGMCEVTDWTDIVAIYTSDSCTIGLKSDGTAVVTGGATIDFTDIRMPVKTLPARNGNETKQDEIPVDQKSQYEAAEKLLENGETAKAAIAFGKLAGYKDSRERSFAVWDTVARRETIGCGYAHVAAVNSNGQIKRFGANDYIPAIYTSHWDDIVAIAVSRDTTVGLTARGTVMAAGEWGDGDIQDAVSAWKDIVAIEALNGGILGLKMDGTVVVASIDADRFDLSAWSDIVDIRIVYETEIVGLKADGTVVATGVYGDRVKDWSDIVSICAGHSGIMGLKSDGSVLADSTELPGWGNITSMNAEKGYVGIMADGTVVTHGVDGKIAKIMSDWTDISSVSVGENTSKRFYYIGLKKDGSIVTAGEAKNFVDPENWKDLVHISTGMFFGLGGEYYVAGLKYDGTVVTNSWRYTSEWTDIRLPSSVETSG